MSGIQQRWLVSMLLCDSCRVLIHYSTSLRRVYTGGIDTLVAIWDANADTQQEPALAYESDGAVWSVATAVRAFSVASRPEPYITRRMIAGFREVRIEKLGAIRSSPLKWKAL